MSYMKGGGMPMAGPAVQNPMSWSGNAAGMDIGLDPATWIKKKHPQVANDFWSQVGLTKTDPNLQSQIMGHGQAGMKPPMPAMNMQQLMQMVRGRPQQPQQAGLMAPPQKGFRGTGLWG